MESSSLSRWESFYVIVGSSAGALTGLQFVVMALIADMKRRASTEQIAAFGTPNIVHFSAVLLLSAALSAPWEGVATLSWPLGIMALCGVVYATIVARRARTQEGYQPVFEDWLWHIILPFLAYLLLLTAAIILSAHTTTALFLAGTMSLILLFVGIHNAWDTVTFIVLEKLDRD
jgi:hypothetical protein